jgi:hypothetical protein
LYNKVGFVRYSNYHLLIDGFLISKTRGCSVRALPYLKSLRIEGGHFKLANLHVEHGLIFSTLTGQPPTVEIFTHGKRRRRTALLSSRISNSHNINPVLDKFINVTLPNVEDLGDLQLRKSLVHNSTYTWRLRKYFDWAEVSHFLVDRVLKKEIFMPIFMHLCLRSGLPHNVNEFYLRMLRIPLSLRKGR